MESPAADKFSYAFIGRIKALPFVEDVYLFGSRARGDNRPHSDIDIAVFCPSASDQQWGQVKDRIDEADTLLEIDCVRLDKVDKEFAAEILREGIRL